MGCLLPALPNALSCVHRPGAACRRASIIPLLGRVLRRPAAARITDMAVCVGPPDTIVLSTFTVFDL